MQAAHLLEKEVVRVYFCILTLSRKREFTIQSLIDITLGSTYTIAFNRNKQEEMVLGDMQVRPGEAWEYCPREALRRVCRILKDEFDLVRKIVQVF